MSTVDFELVTVRAMLSGAIAMLQRHPNYGASNSSDGEMLCEVGTILHNAQTKVDSIYETVDSMQAAHSTEGGAA